MIVVGVDILAYFFLEGVKTPAARRLRELDDHWAAPEIWRHEFANILVRACRSSRLPLPDAHRIWREAEDLMRGSEHAADQSGALSLAVLERAETAYDAQYVLLARSLDVKCVTEDARLRRAFPADTICMSDFLGLECLPDAGHLPRRTRGQQTKPRR